MTESKGFLTIIPRETEVLPREFVKKFKFSVSNGKHSLELAAASREEMSRWATAVTRVGQREIADEYDSKYQALEAAFTQNSALPAAATEQAGSSVAVVEDVSAVASAVLFDDHDSPPPPPPQQQQLAGPAGEQTSACATPLAPPEGGTVEPEGDPARLLEQKDEALSARQAEVTALCSLANRGQPHDEARLQELLQAISAHPLHRAIDELEGRQFREEVRDFTAECLAAQRSFVPPHIFQSSLQSLVDDDSLRKVLAARFTTRKATWLVRVSPLDFGRMHHRELTGE